MLKATCGSCGRRKCTMVGEGFFGGVLKGMSSVFNNSALHSIAGMIPGGSASVPIIKGLGKLTDLGHHL
jgi:hypothetical protein